MTIPIEALLDCTITVTKVPIATPKKGLRLKLLLLK